MNKRISLQIIAIVVILIPIVTYFSIIRKDSPAVDPIDSQTWTNNNTWSIIEVPSTYGEHTLTILTGFMLDRVSKKESDYPSILVDSRVKNVVLVAEVDFPNWFKTKYSSYATSPWYFFALKFFIGSFDNWWFYNVFRNNNGWVANDGKRWLDGAKVWKDISGWHVREIPLDKAIVANPSGSYWYTYFYGTDYLNANIWRKVPIWVYFSSTKEFGWWNITLIKSLSIKYTWELWAIKISE